jgi:N-acetylmuramic acid 6-phosphate etherase
MAERHRRHASTSPGLHATQGRGQVLARALAAQWARLRRCALRFPALVAAAEAGPRYALRGGGKLAYAGAGSSGLMALADALELPGTFGIPPDRTPVLFAGGAAALLHMTGGSRMIRRWRRHDLADRGPGPRATR